MVAIEDDGWGLALAIIAQMREPEPFVEPPPTPSQVLLQGVLKQQQDAANQRCAMLAQLNMQQHANQHMQQNIYPYASTSALFTEEPGTRRMPW